MDTPMRSVSTQTAEGACRRLPGQGEWERLKPAGHERRDIKRQSGGSLKGAPHRMVFGTARPHARLLLPGNAWGTPDVRAPHFGTARRARGPPFYGVTRVVARAALVVCARYSRTAPAGSPSTFPRRHHLPTSRHPPSRSRPVGPVCPCSAKVTPSMRALRAPGISF